MWFLLLQLINLFSVESNFQMNGICQPAVYLEYYDDISCLKDELCVGKDHVSLPDLTGGEVYE